MRTGCARCHWTAKPGFGCWCWVDEWSEKDEMTEGNVGDEKRFELTGDPDFDRAIEAAVSVLRVKGEDYTMGSGDRLHNFRTAAAFTGQTPKQVLGVYLYKHVAAVYAYIKNDGQAESEPIESRIVDVINYMLLLYKLVEEERRAVESSPSPPPSSVPF